MDAPASVESKGRDLHVLLAVREDLYDLPGGDTIQIVNTAAALRELGVAVTISCDHRIDLTDFNCVHLWHLERVHETYVHMDHARAQGKPIILSPIYWPAENKPRCVGISGRSRLRWCLEEAKNTLRYLHARSPQQRHAIALALRRGWARCRQEILESAAAILPNSYAEAALICQEMSRRVTWWIVPNGIDVESCQALLDAPPVKPREGVLCVGHFDPRKNQLRLIQALAGADIPVTFVGGARRMHQAYYDRCKRAANPRIRFLGNLRHEEVLQLMRQARVHVCPSRFETPGLANLEAAAMGCSLAVADCPPVREYFQDDAIYFRSDDLAEIRAGVLKALDGPPSPHLARRVMNNYTWRIAAEVTLSAYRQAVS